MNIFSRRRRIVNMICYKGGDQSMILRSPDRIPGERIMQDRGESRFVSFYGLSFSGAGLFLITEEADKLPHGFGPVRDPVFFAQGYLGKSEVISRG